MLPVVNFTQSLSIFTQSLSRMDSRPGLSGVSSSGRRRRAWAAAPLGLSRPMLGGFASGALDGSAMTITMVHFSCSSWD